MDVELLCFGGCRHWETADARLREIAAKALRDSATDTASSSAPPGVAIAGSGPATKSPSSSNPKDPNATTSAPDIAAALEAEPDAAAFFDSLAQFYRRGYLRWIDATKRRPEVRAERIAETIQLLKAGHKERSKP
jgi:hypothetical protein